MKRRNFIKHTSAGAIAGFFSGLWVPGAFSATDQPHNGPILMTIFAGGGWDHSSFSDPRNNTSINHWARSANAGTAGRLKYAPMAENAEFFNKYYQDMLVFNGVDLRTGGHGSADRTQITGQLSSRPTINALYAATSGKNLPMPWLLERTATFSEGIQPYTQLPKVKDLRRMASTNTRSDNSIFIRDGDMELINRYRETRLNSLTSQADLLPYTQRKAGELLSATTDRGLMGRLADAIPDQLDTTDLKGDNHRMIEPLHRMLIAAAAGVNATSALRTRGNFDSHKDHDRNHTENLTELTRAIDYVWTKAGQLSIDNRLVLHISSDVGRTPRYNGSNGKDHWSSGSTVIMMKNQNWTNRVVGVSGPAHEKVKIDPATLQPVTSGGVQLETAHVHQALRQILGIENHPLSQRFNFNVDDIDILNPGVSSPIPA